MFRTDYREAKKKEQIRIIGEETGIEDIPYTPSRVPVWCPVCGYIAWAIIEEEVYVTHCMRACSKPIKNHLIKCEKI